MCVRWCWCEQTISPGSPWASCLELMEWGTHMLNCDLKRDERQGKQGVKEKRKEKTKRSRTVFFCNRNNTVFPLFDIVIEQKVFGTVYFYTSSHLPLYIKYWMIEQWGRAHHSFTRFKSRACGIHTNRGMYVILCYCTMNNSLTVYCSLHYSCISSIKLPSLYY